jgi:DNA helicase IV
MPEDNGSDANPMQREIAAEQRHVDRVYARMAQLRRDAARAEREGYRIARVGTSGSLVERDAMVFHAARRRHVLDAEHEGLVFGRLDLRDGSAYHVGRLGVRDEDAEPLLIDWRRRPPRSTGPPPPPRTAWYGGG